MVKDINLIQTVIYAIQGAIIGVGAILPGISGGVLCVAFGLYEPLMEFLTSPKQTIKKKYKMFIPFFVGWAAGFVLLARLVEIFFDFAPEVALFLFFGLVCGTIPDMFKKSELSDAKAGWTPFVVSLALSYVMFHIMDVLGKGTAFVVPANFFSFLFCGFMWGLSLIVPGLSSSTVLIYFGLFEPLTNGIGGFDFAVLMPFVLGIVITALALAKLVNMLFKKHYAIISRITLGFVISSSLKTLPSEMENPLTIIISVVCCALGFTVAFLMEKQESKQKQ